MDNLQIGDRIAAGMKRKGWQQKQLAFHAGMPQAHISLLLAGKREPKASTLRRLAQALDVSADYLIGL